jgi:hypothetical protein
LNGLSGTCRFFNSGKETPMARAALHPRLRPIFRSASFEGLEPRRLLSFAASFPAGATLTQRADVNASRLLGEQMEGNVYINPTNPRNVVAFAIDLAQINPEKCWYSMDGGLTYAQSLIPNPPGRTGNGDPAAVFDRQGNLYFVHLTTGLSASIAKSTDGGQTWAFATLASLVGGVDKCWIGAGPNPANLNQDIIYVTYRRDVNEGQTDSQIHVVRSLDGGVTFVNDVIINDQSIAGIDRLSTFPRPVVRPSDGRLYVVWDDESNSPASSEIKMDYSDDGGVTWHADQLIGTTPVTRGNTTRWDIPAQPNRGVLTVPSLAVAQTGAFEDRLYVAYTISPLGRPNSDIQVAWTDDDTGAAGTWNFTVPHTVTTNSQFHPWIETDPMTGVPYVSWLDAAGSATNQTVRKTGTFSIDGGVTWLPPITVADAPSDQSLANPNRVGQNYLEYDTPAAFAGMAFDSWADNSNSTGNNPNGTADLDWYTDRVVLGGHVITVTGTTAADTYTVRMDASGTFLQIWENTPPVGVPTFTMLEDAVDGLNFFLGAGDDVINVDALDGSMPLVIRGGAGQDLIVLGSATGAVLSPTTIDGGDGFDVIRVVETGGGAAATILPSPGDDDVFVNTGGAGNADVLFDATQRLGTLQIEGGGVGKVTADGATVLTVTRLDLAGGGAGRLDLNDNTLIVDYTGASPFNAINGFVASGYNGGTWTGTGISSGVAAGLTSTAIGIAEATDLFIAFPALFAGQLIDNTTVLARYTLYGDTDLNRNVNLDDFNRLASNFGQTPRRWSQGDFDYNANVNLDDFNRLAGNFGQVVAPAAAAVAARSGGQRIGSGAADRVDEEDAPTLDDLLRSVGRVN